jgi:hypothetical protein
MAGFVPMAEAQVEKEKVEVTLPKDANPIDDDQWAIDCLATRELTVNDIKKFNICASRSFIYVPITERGKVVQYVGRRIDRSRSPEDGFSVPKKLRYDYFPGVPISHYFLGWEESRLWRQVTLVENTFNAIWLRDLKVTTNFGSHLSDTHIEKILRSRIKKVILLWDGNALKAAHKARRKLENKGVKTHVIQIDGQPDDYYKEDIKSWIKELK